MRNASARDILLKELHMLQCFAVLYRFRQPPKKAPDTGYSDNRIGWWNMEAFATAIMLEDLYLDLRTQVEKVSSLMYMSVYEQMDWKRLIDSQFLQDLVLFVRRLYVVPLISLRFYQSTPPIAPFRKLHLNERCCNRNRNMLGNLDFKWWVSTDCWPQEMLSVERETLLNERCLSMKGKALNLLYSV